MKFTEIKFTQQAVNDMGSTNQIKIVEGLPIGEMGRIFLQGANNDLMRLGNTNNGLTTDIVSWWWRPVLNIEYTGDVIYIKNKFF